MGGIRLRSFLAVAVVGATMAASVPALAQAPGGGPPGGGPPGGMRGMGGPTDRPTMIQRLALDDAALKLTADQQKQIDKLVDGYIAEQAQLREKFPMTQGAPPNQEMMTAMRGARENLNAAVGKVLNDSQRTTWEAAMARRPPGMGGPGGPGGPPPAR